MPLLTAQGLVTLTIDLHGFWLTDFIEISRLPRVLAIGSSLGTNPLTNLVARGELLVVSERSLIERLHGLLPQALRDQVIDRCIGIEQVIKGIKFSLSCFMNHVTYQIWYLLIFTRE